MKNKGFLLSLFIAGSLTANAQDIKEWLSLTPIKMEKPALSHVKNVKDQVFTDAHRLLRSKYRQPGSRCRFKGESFSPAPVDGGPDEPGYRNSR